MKRKIILIAIAMMTALTASAQKRGSEEINQLKEREAAMQRQIDSLCAVNQSNQVLINELGVMIDAFAALQETYNSNSEDVKKLLEQVSALNEQVSALASTAAIQTDETPAETEGTKYVVVGDLCSGLALAKEGLLYGYVNAAGQYVIPAQYEQASSFCEGLAKVMINGKWGFIDPTGNLVIQAQFEYADDFGTNNYHNMVRVKINGKWGIINKQGKFVVPAKNLSIHLEQSSRKFWYIDDNSEYGSTISRDGIIETR